MFYLSWGGELPKTHIKHTKLSTLISISISDKRLLHSFQYLQIPKPSHIQTYSDDIHILTWNIEGYIYGNVQLEWYNDIKQKLILILDAKDTTGIIHDLSDYPLYVKKRYLGHETCNKHSYKEYGITKHIPVYKFDDFAKIEDLRYEHDTFTKYNTSQQSTHDTGDYVFDTLRKAAYYKYKVDQDNFTMNWLYEQLITITKDVRRESHKVKLIYDWVLLKYNGSRYVKSFVSRSVNAKLIRDHRSDSKYKLFVDYIKFFKLDLDDINKSKLSRILKLSRNTIAKYIHRFLNLNIPAHFISCIGVNPFGAVLHVPKEGRGRLLINSKLSQHRTPHTILCNPIPRFVYLT